MHDNDGHHQNQDTNNTTPGDHTATPTPHPETPDTQPGPHSGHTADGQSPPRQDSDPVATLETELAQTREKLLRTLAEAENARKRADKQTNEMRTYAIESLAYDLLPVADGLDRALAAVSPDQNQALLDGVGMVRKGLQAALERHGVTPVEADTGAVFDPSVHQAVSQIPSTEPKGHIAATFTPGWKIGDRALRAAMVAVSSGEPPDASRDSQPEASPPLSKPGDIVDTSV